VETLAQALRAINREADADSLEVDFELEVS